EMAVTRHIADGHLARIMEPTGHHADRRFDAMLSWPEPSQVGQRVDQADGAVPAHAEIADVVEEDDAGGARSHRWQAEQSADENIRAARFGDHGGTKGVVLGSEHVEPGSHGSWSELRPTIDPDARWFASGVRIHHLNSSQSGHAGTLPCHRSP